MPNSTIQAHICSTIPRHIKGQGPRRRCCAKKILRNGNLVGKIFIFKDFEWNLIPLLFDFFGEAGWIGRETEGDWKRPCAPLANRYPLAKLSAATEKSRFWAFSRAYGRRNFSQSPLRARNRSSFAVQYLIKSFYDHGSHATSSLGRFSLALQVGRFLAPRPTRLQSQGKAPWGRGWSPWGDQSRGELFYHRLIIGVRKKPPKMY